MDPFETKKVHSGTTGLVDNWREKLAPPPSTLSPQLPTPRTAPTTPEHQRSPSSSIVMVTPTPVCV